MNKDIKSILRVDHAGEYGAVRIYNGQLRAMMRKYDIYSDEQMREIENMRAQEEDHLSFFSNELIDQKGLTTAFLPIWHLTGYLAGYFSALIGKDFAMTMTKAVEEVIDEHYIEQICYLNNDSLDQIACPNNDSYNKKLADKLERFRKEELEHRDYAVHYNSQQNLSHTRVIANNIFEKIVKMGCRVAIFISKRI